MHAQFPLKADYEMVKSTQERLEDIWANLRVLHKSHTSSGRKGRRSSLVAEPIFREIDHL
jgi:hypothetical protein